MMATHTTNCGLPHSRTKREGPRFPAASAVSCEWLVLVVYRLSRNGVSRLLRDG